MGRRAPIHSKGDKIYILLFILLGICDTIKEIQPSNFSERMYNMQKDEFRYRLLLTVSVIVMAAIVLLVVLRFTDNTLAEFSYFPLEDGTITIEGYSGDPKKLEIPDTIDGKTVSSIAEGAFTAQKKLQEIVLPKTVTEIGPRAFADCENLKSVTAPGVTKIGIEAFQGCDRLKEATFAPNLAIVDDRAFHSCGRLQTFAAPKTLTEIGTDAFVGCENLAMDVSENPLAADVAAQYGISTDGSDTARGMWLRIGGVTLLLGALVGVVWWIFSKSHKEKQR